MIIREVYKLDAICRRKLSPSTLSLDASNSKSWEDTTKKQQYVPFSSVCQISTSKIVFYFAHKNATHELKLTSGKVICVTYSKPSAPPQNAFPFVWSTWMLCRPPATSGSDVATTCPFSKLCTYYQDGIIMKKFNKISIQKMWINTTEYKMILQ